MQRFYSLLAAATAAMATMTAGNARMSELRPAPSRAEAPEAITTQPQGELKVMQRSCMAYRPLGDGYSMDQAAGGTLLNVVFGEDNAVYVQNWITFDYPGNPVWIKGKIEGESVVFNFPQVGYQDGTPGSTLTDYLLYVMATDYDKGIWTPEITENQTVVFDYKDGVMTQRGHDVIGMGAEPKIFYGYGEYDCIIAPIDGEPVSAPADADWTTMSMVNEEWGGRYPATMDGLDAYIKGLSTNLPEACIKCQISQSGTEVTIPSNQYLGSDWSTRTAYYLMATNRTGEYDNDYLIWRYEYTFTPDYKVNLDIENWRATSVDSTTALLVNGGNQMPNPINSYANFTMSYQPNYGEPAKPATPTIREYQAYDPETAEYVGAKSYMAAIIPVVDVDGNLLDFDELYYNVLVDTDEPYTFDADSYPADMPVFDKEITDIPVTFRSAQPDNPWASPVFNIEQGNVHSMLLPFDVDHVGIQTVYKAQGQVVKSDATYWNLSGIHELAGSKAQAPVYYDLQGREINHPGHGFFIKKQGDKVVKVIR